MSGLVAVPAALGSAGFFAAATVLQHRSAAAAPEDQHLRVRLLVHLVRQRAWLLGTVASTVGIALHAVALGTGQLAVVQPLLVTGLLFALPLSVALDHRRLRREEWAWALVTVAGLALFLVVARPAPGQALPLLAPAVAVTAVGGLIVVACVMGARRGGAVRRAALLGVATGVVFGLTAGAVKSTVTLLSSGVGGVLTSWPLYVLVALAGSGLLLNQSAYQVGPLAASLPSLTVADPVVSIVLGALAFREDLAVSAPAVTGQLVGLVAMSAGVVQVARLAAATAPRRTGAG